MRRREAPGRCPSGAGPEPSPGGGGVGTGPGSAAPAGRSAGRMPAGAESVRGHVTAAIRALRAHAPLPPRLLPGRAPSRHPASPSQQPAAAAAARPSRQHHDRYAPRRPPPPGPPAPRPALPPRASARPAAPGEFLAGRRPPQSYRLAAVGRAASCVSRCPAAPEAGAAAGNPGRCRGGQPGGAWALCPSPRSCFRLRALPPALTVKGGRSSCGGAGWGWGAGSRGRLSRAPERGGIARRPPPPPASRITWKGRPRGGDAGGPGPAPLPAAGALAATPSLFLGLWGRVAES